MTLEWSRPLVVKDSTDSMDFEYGKEYLLYLSYFLANPKATTNSSSNLAFGAEDDGKGPPTW